MAILGESSRIPPAIGVYRVDFLVLIPLRHEDNAFTIWRP